MILGNLRAIANNTIQVVNQDIPATLMISTGSTVDPTTYKQVPTYDSVPVKAQVQPLSTGDIRQLDSLNIQGAEKAIYLDGVALAINRIKNLGGDIIVFAPGLVPEGTTWLVKANLEQWGGTWCKVAVTLQDDDLS